MNILTILGGVALFLYGMNVMGNGLEKISSGRLESILQRLAGHPVKGVLLGMSVTAIIQSSSATTVMVVGFVTAGIMTLPQAAGVIMGANIGTTMTAQILRLGDLENSSSLLSLFNPTTLAPVIATVGIVLYILPSRGSRQDVGHILLGFGVLFFGMNTMSDAARSIDITIFTSLFDVLSNPWLGLLAGTVITAIIQSSSAAVGILQALSSTGTVTFAVAAPYIMGANIGTCVTALISCVGTNRNAKRAAMIHLYFNIIGSALFFTLYSLGKAFLNLPFMYENISMGTIANFHSIFNISTTLLILPFVKLLIRLAEKTIPESKDPPEPGSELVFLNEHFLTSPSLALDNARKMVTQMGTFARKNYRDAILCLSHFDKDKHIRIKAREENIDKMEDMVNAYLIKLTERDLSAAENTVLNELMHTIGDFERIGDYTINLAETASVISEGKMRFSDVAMGELTAIFDAVAEIIELTLQAYEDLDQTAARCVEPLEQTIDLMDKTLRERHINRLKKGLCSVDAGSHLLETLISLERIADHCSNVALYVLRRTVMETRAAQGNTAIWSSHDYVRSLHRGDMPEYRKAQEDYAEKYLGRLSQPYEDDEPLVKE